ncbi:MFS transporter [Streptomyces sp. NPDC097610]|uniref:MFS transporter n=1 Tax=Streptomyces sp. NPDC097610 TaxID=3157227 RepID=UPI003318E6C3
MTACRPLRIPLFRRHVTARVLSWTGTAVSPVALAFAVLHIGGGSQGLGLVLAAEMGSLLVMLLIGGAVADQVSRTRVLAVANAGAGAGQGLAALLVASGQAQVWHLVVLAVVGGVTSAFSGPAASGVVREVVPVDELQQANALLRLAQNSVKAAGPALGGVLVAVVGPAWAIGWDAVTYLIAAVLYVRLRLPAERVRIGPPGMLGGIAEGWRAFVARRWLWLMVGQSALVVPCWLISYQTYGPVYGQQRLGGAPGWGLVMSAFTCGLIVGASVALVWRPRRVGWLVCTGTAVLAAPMAVMAAGRGLVLVAAAAAVAGCGQTVASTVWTGLVQRRVPDGLYGRVSSISTLAQLAPVPVTALLAGVVAGHTGVRRGLAVCAVVTVAAAGVPLCRRRVRALTLPQADAKSLARR